ncbi:hypothetical protein NQZ68_040850 [Dissostichus eleginoides]|nr:hypothetical protein NQZ68_040850 [Dissostichus eleginoides]
MESFFSFSFHLMKVKASSSSSPEYPEESRVTQEASDNDASQQGKSKGGVMMMSPGPMEPDKGTWD